MASLVIKDAIAVRYLLWRSKMKKILVMVALLLMGASNKGAAEAPAGAGQPQAQAGVAARTLTVLATTDTSSFSLGPQIQTGLTALFVQAQNFSVQPANFALASFSEADVAAGFKQTQTDLMAFGYLETERLSLFLFDSRHPKEFIVVSQPLVDPMLGNQVTPQVVEYKLRLNFNQLLTQLYASQFQPLPGAATDASSNVAMNSDDPKVRAEQSRRLFAELQSLETSKYYLGASIGMARYAGGGLSDSTVNFGAWAGMRAMERTRFELGADFFAYALLHIDARYQMPIAEKLVTMNLTLSLGRVLGGIATAQFAQEASLKSGAIVFGPGISFDIPLLGAQVRGDVRLYFGGGSILVGSYGISYSI